MCLTILRRLTAVALPLVISLAALTSGACRSAERANPRVRLATTTSTEASGLLDFLLPHFQRETGYDLDIVAVGTGAALKLGANGDVDVVLVHARALEEEFMSAGHGQTRRKLMVNDFIILGPKNDPAGVRATENATQAFQRIAQSEVSFVSRGDRSGTHHMEQSIWAAAGITPEAPGAAKHTGLRFLSAGRGMAEVLFMTAELGGYTIADRGTWLALRDKLALVVLHEGDPDLLNPYSIITVAPKKHDRVNERGAEALLNWLLSERGRGLIAGFTVGGEQLFRPTASPTP